MEKGDDLKAQIEDLQERRKFLAILVTEYKDRLKYNGLRDAELDRSTDELRVLTTQIDTIDAALAELQDKPDI